MCYAKVDDLKSRGIEYGEDMCCEFIFTVYDVMDDFTSNCLDYDVEYDDDDIIKLIKKYGGESLCDGLLPFSNDSIVNIDDVDDELNSILIKRNEIENFIEGD